MAEGAEEGEAASSEVEEEIELDETVEIDDGAGGTLPPPPRAQWAAAPGAPRSLGLSSRSAIANEKRQVDKRNSESRCDNPLVKGSPPNDKRTAGSLFRNSIFASDGNSVSSVGQFCVYICI